MQTELKFDDNVIAKIVGITSSEVKGIHSMHGGMIANVADKLRKEDDPTKGVSVDTDDQHVTVNLDAVLRYGESAPDVFDRATKAIAKNVKDMTGMTVDGVTMTVKDMLTEDEIEAEEAKNNDDNDKK
ncbi:Asp23/Gls24 family envelope stress response protein [Lacticaseibacillus zhaodongensis]|uniref:Asp23/Gls24 family envelope stress response protein n=1 Tax=Lacticaseibacillus zhaodongensis TaxID=2668065 RepID=UPI0035315E50